ncbi:Uncharacterized protein APZ42_004864 [Daphnia magna]|uniref:Uncharacterized protein n=1 Tax=Daphnia magna TaxID=35525 RepID=A0A164GSR7_9CRUS|nr:Uncharacterized protein APZ42_004864 [Daphnia magna]
MTDTIINQDETRKRIFKKINTAIEFLHENIQLNLRISKRS